MPVKELIALLQKCNPEAQVMFCADRCELIEFVEHNIRGISVALCGSKPAWKDLGEEESVEIEILSESKNFAEITYHDL